MQDIYILGSGAMGCLWASYFPPEQSVHFIQRAPKEATFSFQVLPYATKHVTTCHAANELTQPIKHLIVATKAYDALAAIQSVAHLLTDATQVVLLQNGLGSQQAITDAFPHVAIFACSSTEGAYKQDSNTLVHAGKGQNLIGAMNHHAKKEALADWLPDHQYQWQDHIEATLWRKFMINCAINPLTVLYQCQNGKLIEEPKYLSHMQQICEEIDLLSQAQTLNVDSAFVVARQVCQLTAQNFSSMLQDHRAQNPTEIDFMTGYLLKLATRYKIPCPKNAEVYESILNLG